MTKVEGGYVTTGIFYKDAKGNPIMIGGSSGQFANFLKNSLKKVVSVSEKEGFISTREDRIIVFASIPVIIGCFLFAALI